MAHIPEVEERIKREVSIQRLAEARGVKLHRSGKELIGLCPFHDDRNSQPEHRPGEERVELQGRLRRGRRRNPVGDAGRGSELPSRAGAAAEGASTLPSCGAGGEESHGAEAAAADRRHSGRQEAARNRGGLLPRTLKRSPEAQQYLVKRGLQSAEIVDRFQLGYANRTLCLHLPASNRAPATRSGRG